MTKMITFVKEAWAELKQVAWLTPAQMIASTWIVIILVFIIALYIAGVDLILNFLLRFII